MNVHSVTAYCIKDKRSITFEITNHTEKQIRDAYKKVSNVLHITKVEYLGKRK